MALILSNLNKLPALKVFTFPYTDGKSTMKLNSISFISENSLKFDMTSFNAQRYEKIDCQAAFQQVVKLNRLDDRKRK